MRKFRASTIVWATILISIIPILLVNLQSAVTYRDEYVNWNFVNGAKVNGVDLGPGGGGGITVSGTPTTGQAAQWTDADTLQGVNVTGSGSYVKATAPTITNAVLVNPNISGGSTNDIIYVGGDPYNAVCNGLSDDTTAVQAAVTARNAAPGATLQFPAGTCYVSTTMEITTSGIIQGMGPGATIIGAGSATAHIFKILGTTTIATIRDMTISTGVTRTAGAAIYAGTVNPMDDAQSYLHVHNVVFESQWDCIELANSTYAVIADSKFSAFNRYGIRFYVSSNPDAGELIIRNNVFARTPVANTIGVYSSAGGVRIIGNKFLGLDIAILGESDGQTGDFFVGNNSIENYKTYGVLVRTPTPGVLLANVHIVDNQFLDGDVSKVADISVSGNVRIAAIIGNTMVNYQAAYGIVIIDDGSDTPTPFSIISNTIIGNDAPGSVGIAHPNVDIALKNIVMSNSVTGQETAHAGTGSIGDGTGGDALTSDPLSQFAATTSAQLASVITNETGTGLAVFNTSPTFITPVLGAASATSVTASGQLISTVATGTAPLVVSSTTNVANLNASQLGGKTFAAPAAIGSGTPAGANFTTIGATGQFTSTVTTGTAPLVIASTTAVSNLKADTVVTNANLTGGITSSGNVTTITRSCQAGLGDGTNAIVAATYVPVLCYNAFGATMTITSLKCFSDNNGTTTLDVKNAAGTSLLTAPITCTNSFASGTQSATVTIASASYMKLSVVADGTSKNVHAVVTGTF